MTQAATELLNAILALPEPDRSEVIESIAIAVESPEGLHPAWGPELRRRAAQLDSGEVVGVPYEEVRKRMLATLAAAGLTHE